MARINPSDDKAIIRQAFLNGWAFCEGCDDARNVAIGDLDKLAIDDKPVQQMFRAGHCCDQAIDGLMAAMHPSRADTSILLDDEVGPALRTLATLERCSMPDALLPPEVELKQFVAAKAESLGISNEDDDLVLSLLSMKQNPDGTIGHGNIGLALGNQRSWDGRPDGDDAGCDLQDPFRARVHSVRFYVDLSNAPSRIKRDWPKIAYGAQECMRHKGYRIRFVDKDEPYELYIRWESIAGSTIGWFTIFSGGTCKQTIGGRMDINYADDWYMVCILLIHEALFHGFGHGHTRGGIGNPSILRTRSDANGNPTWIGDPAERSYDGWGGGESVTLTGDPVTGDRPGPPDDDDDTIAGKLAELRSMIESQSEVIANLAARVDGVPTRDQLVTDVHDLMLATIRNDDSFRGRDGIGFDHELISLASQFVEATRSRTIQGRWGMGFDFTKFIDLLKESGWRKRAARKLETMK